MSVEIKTEVHNLLVRSLKRQSLDAPCKDGSPDGHGRFSLNGNGDGYIGNVVKGSISHSDTLGCLSPAVDSSQPTCIYRQVYKIMLPFIKKQPRKNLDICKNERAFQQISPIG